MPTTTDTSTIRKELELSIRPERAFEMFTAEIARWWPTTTHSVGGADTVDVTFEARVGGRISETTREGETHLWGTVLVCEPPHRMVMTWHPGLDPADPSEIELRFEPTDDGTRFVLEHRGWERSAWRDRRASYETGWDVVLADFEDTLRTASPASPGPA